MMPVPAENSMLRPASLSATRDIDGVRIAPQGATGRRAFWRAEWFLFVLFVAPNLLLFGIFSYWPMISNLYLSLVRWDMISPVKTFVGSGNYAYLFNDDTFRLVLRNSAVFTVGSVVVPYPPRLRTTFRLTRLLTGRILPAGLLIVATSRS